MSRANKRDRFRRTCRYVTRYSTLCQRRRHQRIGVPVAHAVFVLEEFDQLHVLGRQALADEGLPFGNRAAVGLLDRGEVGGGALYLAVGHVRFA